MKLQRLVLGLANSTGVHAPDAPRIAQARIGLSRPARWTHGKEPRRPRQSHGFGGLSPLAGGGRQAARSNPGDASLSIRHYFATDLASSVTVARPAPKRGFSAAV